MIQRVGVKGLAIGYNHQKSKLQLMVIIIVIKIIIAFFLNRF